MTKRLYGDVLGDEDSSYECLITGGVVELPSCDFGVETLGLVIILVSRIFL